MRQCRIAPTAAGKPLVAALKTLGSEGLPFLSLALSRKEPAVRKVAAGQALFLAVQNKSLEEARALAQPIINDTDEDVRAAAGPAIAWVERLEAKEATYAAEAAKTKAEKAEINATMAKEVAEASQAKAVRAEQQATLRMEKAEQREKAADEEKKQALHAKAAAELMRSSAEKESEQAKKEKEQAKKEKKVVLVAKVCSEALTKHVRFEMSCAGLDGEEDAFIVKVPDGYMLRGSPVQAYRCTNRVACRAPDSEGEGYRRWLGTPGNDSEAGCPLGPVGRNGTPHPISPMCRPGYDNQSDGCSSCSSGYGRSSTDPFACEECGVHALQLAGFLLMPWAVFAMSYRANSQARRSGHIFNDLLKIFQSYGSGAAVVLSALVASESYPSLPSGMQGFLSSGDMSIQSAVLYSGSLDCLVGSRVGIGTTLVLSLSTPATICLASAVILAIQHALGLARRPLKYSVVLLTLVLGNQFLPQIVGASMRGMPCVHMQKDNNGDAEHQQLAYDLGVDCGDRPVSLYAIVVCTSVIAAMCGPCYWWHVLRKKDPKASPPTAESSGAAEGSDGSAIQDQDPTEFLSGNYRDGCVSWEAWVLIRKIALTVNCTLAPMTYSPGQHITQALIILLVSLVSHLYAMPYKKEKRMLNIVEAVGLANNTMAMILAMYVSTNIWSATSFARMLATAFAGTQIIVWFSVLIVLMIHAKWTEVRGEHGENGDIDSSGNQEHADGAGAGAPSAASEEVQ